jgi:hypothetical protein
LFFNIIFIVWIRFFAFFIFHLCLTRILKSCFTSWWMSIVTKIFLIHDSYDNDHDILEAYFLIRCLKSIWYFSFFLFLRIIKYLFMFK